MSNLQSKLLTAFQQRFGSQPAYIVRAPGRVNLIGEHTDYNDGFVLPMAIDRAIWIALRPRADRRVLIHSLEFSQPTDFLLDDIQPAQGWESYVRGAAWALQQEHYALQGWEGVLASDIPVGAGLSSSAALELAVARAFWAVQPWNWNPTKMAFAAKRVENDWLGLQTGIMDQMISANGQADHALLIDCRTLDTKLVPLPQNSTVVVLDTATRRGLVDSAYNQRVEQCQAASQYFSVPALRDVSPALFAAQATGLDALIQRRARHIVSENARVLAAVDAMQAGDAAAFGQLMNASHASLRDDYEVSSRELNMMVEIAQAQAGCYGARMTGAGFGGCAVALVRTAEVATFAAQVTAAYQAESQIKPDVYICEATNGAELVEG